MICQASDKKEEKGEQQGVDGPYTITSFKDYVSSRMGRELAPFDSHFNAKPETSAFRLILHLESWRCCSEEICNHGVSLLIVTTCSP